MKGPRCNGKVRIEGGSRDVDVTCAVERQCTSCGSDSVGPSCLCAAELGREQNAMELRIALNDEAASMDVDEIKGETKGKSGDDVDPTRAKFPVASTAAPAMVSRELPPKSMLARVVPSESILTTRICGRPEGSMTLETTKRLPEASAATVCGCAPAGRSRYRSNTCAEAAARERAGATGAVAVSQPWLIILQVFFQPNVMNVLGLN